MKFRRITEPITCEVEYTVVRSGYGVQASITTANTTHWLSDSLNNWIKLGLSLIKVNEMAKDGTNNQKRVLARYAVFVLALRSALTRSCRLSSQYPDINFPQHAFGVKLTVKKMEARRERYYQWLETWHGPKWN